MLKRLNLVLAIICVCISMSAQEKIALSLEEAKEYAYEHNRSIQNASIDIQVAERSKWQTLATMLPQISASFDYLSYCGYSMELMGISIPMNPSGTFGATAAVALSGSQVVGTIINDIAIDMSNISLDKTKQSIEASVTKLYVSALAMEKTINLLKLSLANIESLYEMTINSVKVGVAEQTDADKLSVQVASLQNSIKATERSIEMLYNSLRLQLGTPVDCEITLTDSLDIMTSEEATINLLSKSFELDNNYDYQLLKKNLDMSDMQIKLTVMDYLPKVSAYYQYSAKTYFGQDEGMNMTPPNMVGISFSLPIWSSGQRTTKLQSAKLNNKISQNTFLDTKDALLVQDRQLRFNLSSAYESFEIQNKNIEVSQRVFDNISNKYEYGRASSLEVTNANTDLISAQSNYIQALLELVNAQIELQTLINE